jgi:hypothetical protein
MEDVTNDEERWLGSCQIGRLYESWIGSITGQIGSVAQRLNRIKKVK